MEAGPGTGEWESEERGPGTGDPGSVKAVEPEALSFVGEDV